MSDRLAWLDQWCPQCRAAPGDAMPARPAWGGVASRRTAAALHVARGWRERCVPDVQGLAGRAVPYAERSRGLAVHSARLRPGVPSSSGGQRCGRSSSGAARRSRSFRSRVARGGAGVRRRSRCPAIDGEELVDVERWTSRDELAYALEAPVWDRFGTFAGQPFIRGEVIWTVADRSVVIVGTRGDRAVRGDRRVSGPCRSQPYRAGRFRAQLARGPPPSVVLGNEKDRAATRSSRT